MSKRILIVGGTSKLGKSFFDYLTRMNVNVSRSVSSKQLALTNKNDKIYNFGNDTRILELHQFSHVFIFAGITSISECENNPYLANKTNIEFTTSLLSDIASNGSMPIFISSSAVFGDYDKAKSINDVKTPINKYGFAKSMVEDFMLSELSEFQIIRLSKVIDPNWKLAEIWKRNLLMGEEITVFKNKYIAPIFLNQVNQLLFNLTNHRASKIHHLSNSRDFSYSQIAEKLLITLELDRKSVSYRDYKDGMIRYTDIMKCTDLDSSFTFPDNNIAQIIKKICN